MLLHWKSSSSSLKECCQLHHSSFTVIHPSIYLSVQHLHRVQVSCAIHCCNTIEFQRSTSILSLSPSQSLTSECRPDCCIGCPRQRHEALTDSWSTNEPWQPDTHTHAQISALHPSNPLFHYDNKRKERQGGWDGGRKRRRGVPPTLFPSEEALRHASASTVFIFFHCMLNTPPVPLSASRRTHFLIKPPLFIYFSPFFTDSRL